MKPELVILAAGMASRYGSLKQWDAIGPYGETLMDYSVQDAVNAGAGKVVFVIREENSGEFRKEIIKKHENKVNIEFAFQEISKIPDGISYPEHRVKPWGTVHALLMAEEKIHGPFMVINADDFYGYSSYSAMVNFLNDDRNKDESAMIAFPVDATLSGNGSVTRAVCSISPENYLLEVTEKHDIIKSGHKIISRETDKNIELPSDSIVSMNFWGFSPAVFPSLRKLFRKFLDDNSHNQAAEFILPEAVNMMIKLGKARIKVLHAGSRWFGITYKEDKPLVMAKIRELIREGEYPGFDIYHSHLSQ